MIRMFSFRFSLLLLLAIITLSQSCSIEKRRYRSGFHVERYSLTRPQVSEKTTPPADSTDTSVPEYTIPGDQESAPQNTSHHTEKPTNYEQISIRESAHVPDTFIVEDAKSNSPLTPSQRVKYLMKNNQDPEGLPIVQEAETAFILMLVGWGTTVILGIGPIIALVSLIFLLIASSKLRNSPEGTYSPDNYRLIRRTFWLALACFLAPLVVIGLILLLLFI